MAVDYEAIGRRIAEYRKINNQTAANLAALVDGLSRDNLAKIETGKRESLDIGLLLAIADALKVPPTALIFDVSRPLEQVSDLEILESLSISDRDGERRVTRGMTVEDALTWYSRPDVMNERLEGSTAAGHHVARQVSLWRGYLTSARRVSSLISEYGSIDKMLHELDALKRQQIANYVELAWQFDRALRDAGIQSIPEPEVPEHVVRDFEAL